MALVIWYPVSTVNAFIFFAIDIPVVWAIHRSLLALQGYYLYRAAKSGQIVPIARSRVPIVSGELLRGVSRLPYIFLLVNVAVLFCIFFATLEVDADKRDVWTEGIFTNMSSLAMPNDTSSHDRDKGKEICSRTAATSVEYWPSVFNISFSGAENQSCQAGHPDFSPMLTASCYVHPWNEDCLPNATEKMFEIEFGRVESKVVHKFGVLFPTGESVLRERWVEEFILSDPRLTFLEGPIYGNRAHAFLFKSKAHGDNPFNDDGNSNSSAVMFFHNTTTNSWLFSLASEFGHVGFRSPNGTEWTVLEPIRISLHGSASIEYLMHACRSYSEVSYVIQATGSLAVNSVLSSSRATFDSLFYLDQMLRESLRKVPLPTSVVGYYRNSKKADVTNVSVRGTILYGIVIGLAVLLLPLKELLLVFAVRRKGVPESHVFLNDFDQLSKTHRFEMERLKGVPLSGEFALWQVHAAQTGCLAPVEEWNDEIS